jgi:NAD(P)-dependent dehydrogenase (short-subunit alcohol dehydrogenase family)
MGAVYPDLKDKVVLVTGGASGIGAAIVEAFAGQGARVGFLDLDAAAGTALAGRLGQAGAAFEFAAADLRDIAALKAGVEQVRAALGPIGVLVNNAAATKVQRFLDSTPQDWAPQIDVTVTGTLQVTHAVAKRMAERGSGSIVNLMGDSGRVGESGLLVTATARSTTVGLTRSLARELARFGIRANAVSLALVRTDNIDAHTGGAEDERMKKILAQYPLRRLGRPDDVVPMVLLLASPLSSWTTGQVVSVNGGYAMP